MVFFLFIEILIEKSVGKDPDQAPGSDASDRGLHCLHMSNKKNVRFIWVNA